VQRPRSTRWRWITATVATVAAGMVAGCGGGGDGSGGGGGGVTGPPATPAITLSLSGGSSSVAQGGSSTVTVTVGRSGGFAGPVTLALEGAPANVSGTFAPATLAAGQTSSTLTLSAAAAAAAGQSSLTIRASGQGVTALTASLALTVTATAKPDFSIAVSPATVAVKQGESAASTVNIARTGGFNGSVSLAVSGAPTGVAATLASGSTTTSSVALTVAAGASAAVGSFNLTITGTGTGVTGSRTATLAVSVASSGGGTPTGSIAYEFCGPDAPVWVAVQDGSGPWKRVTAANNVYRFDLPSGRGGVAYVTTESGNANTMVQYGTAAELTAMGKEQCVSDTRKSVNGSVAGLGMTDLANISLGGGVATANGGQPAFTLTNVPGGKRDLIASRTKLNIGGGGVTMEPDRIIIRRDVEAPAGSTLPVLDFGGAEAFAPEKKVLTVNGSNGETLLLTELFSTTSTSGALLHVETTPSATATRTFYGVPAARQKSGDLHMLIAVAYPAGTMVPGDASQQRTAITMFSTPSDRAVTLGPALIMPALTVLGPGRYSAKITRQPEYSSFWTASMANRSAGGGTGNTVTVAATAGYVGAGSTIELAVPEVSSVDGWKDSWLPTGAIFWQTSAAGWEGGWITQPEQDGAMVRTAIRSGSTM